MRSFLLCEGILSGDFSTWTGEPIDEATTRDKVTYGTTEECTGIVTITTDATSFAGQCAVIQIIISHEALFWNHAATTGRDWWDWGVCREKRARPTGRNGAVRLLALPRPHSLKRLHLGDGGSGEERWWQEEDFGDLRG